MDLHTEAALLVERLAKSVTVGPSLGLMSVSIYDTAWVSMISKVQNGQRQWLFPESFAVILDSQRTHGGWDPQASAVDSILNTMSALLAMLWHKKEDLQDTLNSATDIQSRIDKAITRLAEQLNTWEVKASDQVGFEVLIPSLLDVLAREKIVFDFPGSALLSSLRAQKLLHFTPELLYGPSQTTLVHSLEAMIGVIDFDKVRHHKIDGSMMASPSSTAAYLMFASAWDDDAEAYLRKVAKCGQGDSSGGFPSAFPTSVFEVSWVLSSLLEAGFSPQSLGTHNINRLSDFLENTLTKGGGTVGFAPELLSDADDTAKSILTLAILGKEMDPDAMIARFETIKCFQTYLGERTPSFSANCNVLGALLHVRDPHRYQRHAIKAADFLCDAWFAGTAKDKWNISPQYSMMLLTQAFSTLLRQWDKGKLTSLPAKLVDERVPVVLTQTLAKTIYQQSAEGSWGNHSCEVTAYAILTLVCLVNMPQIHLLEPRVMSAIEKGKKYLGSNKRQWKDPGYVWVEKVTYSSAILSETYCLAAMSVVPSPYEWTSVAKKSAGAQARAIYKHAQFFQTLPIFNQRQAVDWITITSMVESFLFVPKLRQNTLDIFPRDEKAEKSYLEYIPFTWVGCRNLGRNTNPWVLWEMMILSKLNYQADAYMESVVGPLCEENLPVVIEIITRLCSDPFRSELSHTAAFVDQAYKSAKKRRRSISPAAASGLDLRAPGRVTEMERVLRRFVKYVLTHTSVQCSPPAVQTQLRHEIRRFLLAHVKQIQDNMQNSIQRKTTVSEKTATPNYRSYYDWVHTISADHTSCPYSFVFFTCLISEPGEECFQTTKQKYLAEDLCRHLATMCRQYNDYGSIARDREEHNLNSVDFPEFHHSLTAQTEDTTATNELSGGPGEAEVARKTNLLWLAEYERECLNTAFSRLEKALVKRPTIVDSLKLFIDVTDLYGQIYIKRDINRSINT